MLPGIHEPEQVVSDLHNGAFSQIVNGAPVKDTLLPVRVPETGVTPATKETPSLFSLSGSTTIITGAGRGLGITLAGAVLESSGNVACLDILSEPSAQEWRNLQKISKSRGLLLSYHQCDVTDEDAMQRVFDLVSDEGLRRNAPLTGTIACAGVQQKLPALEYPKQDFERILRINVTGTFVTAKCAAKKMVEHNIRGSIVMVASMSGNIANRGLTCTAYNSSKSAVQQMCRSLAQEWGQYGIRVNTLSPGYIRTAMTEALLQAEPEVEEKWMAGALLGRLGAPEDFKAPTVFLLSAGSCFMTGSDLRVDGGHCASA